MLLLLTRIRNPDTYSRVPLYAILFYSDINQSLHSQNTPYISPPGAIYGVSIVKILEKIDRVITALHCINFDNHDILHVSILLLVS